MTVFLVHCWCSRSMPLPPEFLPVESLTPSPHKVEGTQFLSVHCPFLPDEQRAWDLPRDPQPAPLNPYLCLYLGFLLIDSYWLGWPGSVFTGSLLASGNPALKSTFLPSGPANISPRRTGKDEFFTFPLSRYLGACPFLPTPSAAFDSQPSASLEFLPHTPGWPVTFITTRLHLPFYCLTHLMLLHSCQKFWIPVLSISQVEPRNNPRYVWNFIIWWSILNQWGKDGLFIIGKVSWPFEIKWS